MKLYGVQQRAFLILTLAAALPASARTIPALDQSPVPDVQVFDEASQPTSLRAMLNQPAGSPVLLLPVYTRCVASCPVLTHNLATALAGMNPPQSYRVVVFSFDPLETAESLRLFRARQLVPPDWKIVRSNPEDIRRLLDFFRYSVMTQNSTLVHPNEVFVLDSNLTWRRTLLGEDWREQELADAIAQTRSPGIVARINANPERLAWIGFAAALLSVSIAGAWMIWRNPFA
jgi:cytochrome oxidase Cu insertion factor (SCO1/SenC/PrrC family)